MKPLTDRQRSEYSGTAELYAAELVRQGAARVQKLVGVALDYGYPTSSSTAAGGKTNNTDDDGVPIQPDTVPERLAITPDREAATARALLSTLRQIDDLQKQAITELKSWHPDRPVRFCSRCKHPLPADSARCQQVDDTGRLCSATEKVERICMICDETQPAGKWLRKGRCDRCRKHLKSKGREWTSIADYELQANVITTETGNGHG